MRGFVICSTKPPVHGMNRDYFAKTQNRVTVNWSASTMSSSNPSYLVRSHVEFSYHPTWGNIVVSPMLGHMKSHSWCGLNDKLFEGSYQWSDGTQLVGPSFYLFVL